MKNSTPTTSIKFFGNGMRINGARELCKVHYSIDGRHDGKKCVMIYERSGNYNERIPGDLFGVQNDSDSMTDYFEHDRAEVFEDHPLYSFVRACAIRAALKTEEPYAQGLRVELAKAEAQQKPRWSWRTPDVIRAELDSRQARIDGYYAELAQLPTGQPTPAEVAQAVHIIAERREAARIAAEQAAEAEQAARRAEYERECEEAARIVSDASERYPPTDGAPYVVINWSERGGLEEGLALSVPAAELVLSQLDKDRAERNRAQNRGGYDKTSFTVHYTLNGEPCTYEGRYDLGDDDGGMIAHIRAHAEHVKTCSWIENAEEHSRAALDLADMLDKLCAPLNGRVLSLSDTIDKRRKADTAAAAEAAALVLSMLRDAFKECTPQPEARPATGRVLSFPGR